MCCEYVIGKIGRSGSAVGGFNEIRNKYWRFCYCHSDAQASFSAAGFGFYLRIHAWLERQTCSSNSEIMVAEVAHETWDEKNRHNTVTEEANALHLLFLIISLLRAIFSTLRSSAPFLSFLFLLSIHLHSMRSFTPNSSCAFPVLHKCFCFGTNKVQSYPARQMNNLKVYFLASLASVHLSSISLCVAKCDVHLTVERRLRISFASLVLIIVPVLVCLMWMCVCGGIHGARTEIQSHSLALSGNKMKSNEAYERYSVRATMPTTEWSSSLKRHYDPTRMIVKCILRVIWATAASSTQCSQNPIIKTVTNKNQQRQNIALRLWKCKAYVLVSRTRACHGQRQCHYSDCVQCVVHCVCCRKCILALFHCEIAFVWCVCVCECLCAEDRTRAD